MEECPKTLCVTKDLKHLSLIKVASESLCLLALGKPFLLSHSSQSVLAAMVALFTCFILVMAMKVAVMGADATVNGARLLSTTDQAKIAAICSSSHLRCLETPLTTKATRGVSRDYSIRTINNLQQDFFLESALAEGNTMTLATNLRDSVPKRTFLSPAAAMSMLALTSSNALQLTKYFGVAPSYDMVTAVTTAAYMCDYEALPEENMAYAAFADAMAAFVSTELGPHVKVLSTSTSAPAVKAEVTIVDVTKGNVAEGKTIVVCHVVDFPELYYCHRVTGTKVIKASLKPGKSSNTVIKGVGVCHIDTSLWLSTHPPFTALSIPRGDETCHWLVESDLVFVPITSATESE